jgi:hypothetical protein
MTMAFVPVLQSDSTCVSLSWPEGFVYTRSEYWAAKQRSGNVGMYLSRINGILKSTDSPTYSFIGSRFGGSRELA